MVINTMRVNGHKGKKTLHILIDSGGTHNFLDEHLARKLRCKLEPIAKQSVAIADGNILQCQFICRNFSDLLSLCLIFYFCPWEVVIWSLEYNGSLPWVSLNWTSNTLGWKTSSRSKRHQSATTPLDVSRTTG